MADGADGGRATSRLSPADRPTGPSDSDGTPLPAPVTPAPPAAGPPVVTYALLPGHWQLQGAQYVWVPADTVPRPVVSGRLVQGHHVRAGEWVWVPAHFD